MTSVLFIYGSTGGNTEMVVENVAEIIKAQKHKVTVQRAEMSEARDLLKYDVIILASPTYGHGLLQEHMLAFTKKLKEIDLKGRTCAVIGVGDPKYEAQYHVESATTLEKILTSHGGELLLPALRVSGSPVRHLKGFIPHWGKQLLTKLK
ncbi:flavodoxin family protein [Candidatus Pacearchaeota archaeon]|nr:flavodoxin family protein [Candidatus Pacearchaeota archaeon]